MRCSLRHPAVIEEPHGLYKPRRDDSGAIDSSPLPIRSTHRLPTTRLILALVLSNLTNMVFGFGSDSDQGIAHSEVCPLLSYPSPHLRLCPQSDPSNGVLTQFYSIRASTRPTLPTNSSRVPLPSKLPRNTRSARPSLIVMPKPRKSCMFRLISSCAAGCRA